MELWGLWGQISGQDWLLCKPEDLSSNLRHPPKNPGIFMHLEPQDRRINGTGWLSVWLQVQGRKDLVLASQGDKR